MKLTLAQGQLKYYEHFLGFNMIISKLVVGNDLVYLKNEKTESNLNIKFIKNSLKSSNFGFIIVENPKWKIPKLCDKLKCSSKIVIFSTKLGQYAPNFYRV